MDSKELYPKETITERPRFGDEGTYAPEDSKQPPRFEDQGTCILEESKQLLGYFTVFTSVPISKVDKTKGPILSDSWQVFVDIKGLNAVQLTFFLDYVDNDPKGSNAQAVHDQVVKLLNTGKPLDDITKILDILGEWSNTRSSDRREWLAHAIDKVLELLQDDSSPDDIISKIDKPEKKG